VREILASIGNLELPGEEEVEFCEHARNFLDWGEQLLQCKEGAYHRIDQPGQDFTDRQVLRMVSLCAQKPQNQTQQAGAYLHLSGVRNAVQQAQDHRAGHHRATDLYPPEPPPLKILPRPTIAGIVLGEDTDDNINR